MRSYVEVPGIPDEPIAAGIVELCGIVLPSHRPVDLLGRLAHHRDPWGVVALEGDQVVGFKLGYCDRPGRFYSWLGGVAPEHRRHGIARELMRRQHERCRAEGYARVRTHTTNGNRAMLVLNLLMDFDVVGTVAVSGKPLKIVMERTL